MDVDRAGPGGCGVAPHLRQQVLTREDPAWPAAQELQQVELGRRQVDGLPVGDHSSARRVDSHPADDIHPLLRACVGAAPAQHSLDAGNELARAERLGQVVVGPKLEAKNPVDLVVTGGHEQDGSPVTVGAQDAADLGAVDRRDADIEHDRDRVQIAGGGKSCPSVGLDVDAEPFAAQVHPLEVGDRPLVFDHQDQTLGGTVADWAARAVRVPSFVASRYGR